MVRSVQVGRVVGPPMLQVQASVPQVVVVIPGVAAARLLQAVGTRGVEVMVAAQEVLVFGITVEVLGVVGTVGHHGMQVARVVVVLGAVVVVVPQWEVELGAHLVVVVRQAGDQVEDLQHGPDRALLDVAALPLQPLGLLACLQLADTSFPTLVRLAATVQSEAWHPVYHQHQIYQVPVISHTIVRRSLRPGGPRRNHL